MVITVIALINNANGRQFNTTRINLPIVKTSINKLKILPSIAIIISCLYILYCFYSIRYLLGFAKVCIFHLVSR